MFGLLLYLHNAGKGGKERERERERRKKCGIKLQKNKQTTKKNPSPCAYTFHHYDPCVLTFSECKILAVLDCEE